MSSEDCQNPSTGVRAGDYRLNSGEAIFWGKNDLGKENIKFKVLNPHWCPMSISTFAAFQNFFFYFEHFP